MIIKTNKNVLIKAEEQHIAFPINNEGYNYNGMATYLINRYWPELSDNDYEIGTVLTKSVGNKIFHALVCFSNKDGWDDNQAEIIKNCFDNISAYGKPIATYLFGFSSIDIENGANFRNILQGMNESEQKISLHTDFTMEEIIRFSNPVPARKKYIVTNIEKVQQFVNTDKMMLIGNAFIAGLGVLTCLCLGNEIHDYYNSNELSDAVFNVRLQDFNILLTTFPIINSILGLVKHFKSFYGNLDLKKNYEHILENMEEESWTR